MRYALEEHPIDEMLVTYSFEGGDDVLKEHIDSCPSCSRYIKEVRAISDTLQELPEVPAPNSLRQDILRSVKKNKVFGQEWFSFDCTTWYKNPLFVGLGLIGLIVFLYIFFVFVL